jgi:carboxyl-terminal processing protease
MELGDGSAVRLTVSRYYTPTGRSIQKPYENKGNEAYFSDFDHRFDDGELMNADSIKVNDTLKYTTPKGKTVYGGGGIIPDVFVAIDTTMYFDSIHYRKLNEFVFDYYDNHRSEFENWSLNDFLERFDKGNKIFNTYIDNFSSEKKELNADEIKNLKLYLKAIFAQQIFDINSYYKIINEQDKMLETVLKLNRGGYPLKD